MELEAGTWPCKVLPNNSISGQALDEGNKLTLTDAGGVVVIY